jgi:asparagine synthase (glutamine-hydrolysing)
VLVILESLDLNSNEKDFIRLPEKGGEFSGLSISQDTSKKQIILERNIFSTIPVYFKFQNKQVLLSDNLLDFNLSLTDISKEAVVSYILTGAYQKPCASLYSNIYRMPAGAKCVISEKSFHYIFEASIFNPPSESLLSLLEKAISTKTSPYSRIASHVSGGLDSSGLSSILKTFFPEKNTLFCAVDAGVDTLSEKEFQNAFEEKFKEKIHFYSSETDAYQFLTAYALAFAEPAYTITLPFLNINLLEELKKQGIHALVMGNDGDGVLGHGYEYVDVLMQKNDVKSLKTAFENISKANVLSVKYPHWAGFSENKKYNLSAMFFLARHRVSAGISLPSFFVLVLRLLQSPSGVLSKAIQLLSGKFNAIFAPLNVPLGLIKEENSSLISISSEGKIPEEYQYFSSEINMASNHFFYNLSKLSNIKIISPFQDFDLLSYCQNVPLKDKFGDGFGRAFYRKELKGILPEKIRNRIHKTSFSTWQLDAIKKLLKQTQVNGISPMLFTFVEQSFVEATFADFERAKEGSPEQKSLSMLVYRILNINIWLGSFRS